MAAGGEKSFECSWRRITPSGSSIAVSTRCPRAAPCIGRGNANPPVLQFDASGKLLRSFGAGLFAYPHGFTIDAKGNLWASDVK